MGSRANGSARPNSDWDYIMYGPSSKRHSASSSVPRGTSGGALKHNGDSGIDIFQTYNPNASGYTTLDTSRPHISFFPRSNK